MELENIRENLAEKAQDLVDEQWRWHLSFNESRRPEDKSKLNLYLRHRNGVFELFWSRFWFVRFPDREASTIARRYINKGKGNKYPSHRLLRHAQEGEVEALLEFENRAAEIRKAIRYIGQIKATERKLEKLSVIQEQDNE